MTTDDVAVALAGYGVLGRRALPDSPLTNEQWRSLLELAYVERLSGLLVSAIQDGAFPATPEQAGEAQVLQVTIMSRVLLLDRLLLRVVSALRDSGIEFRLLKGCAHAHLLYSDPSLRPYVDVDLLVRGEQFAEAVTTLGALGIQRPEPELRPGFDRRFGKGATLRTELGDGIDLHRTFVDGPFAVMIDFNELFVRSEFVNVGGVALPTLAREERVLHACFHAAVSDKVPGLMALRDVVQGCCDPNLDIRALHHIARKFQAPAVVAKAVRSSFDRLAPHFENELVAWSRGYEPSKREAWILRSYEASDRRWAHQAIAALRVVPGVGGKLAYTRAVVLPTRSALTARGRTSRGRLMNASKGLRGEDQRDVVERTKDFNEVPKV